MSGMPDISIVLPIYNVENYLGECLDSLIGQTHENIEIICVDDCSTDGSLAIEREYAARDGRIRLIERQENGTAAQCRKDGTLASRGRYVLFVDPDDLLAENACETLLAEAEKSGADVLHFGAQAFGTQEIPQSRIDMIERMLEPYCGKIEGDRLCRECFVEKCFGFQIWNKLFAGDICRKAMRSFPDGRFPKAQDMLAVYVLLFYARSYQGVRTKPLYRYRVGVGVTGGNVLSRGQIAGYAAQSLIPRAVAAFLEQNGAKEAHEDELCAIEERLWADSFARLKNSVAREDRAYAFDEYCRTWGAPKVIGELAQSAMGSEKQWAADLAGAQSIEFAPRKVRCIAGYYYRLKNGGAQRVAAMLLEKWSQMGLKVVAFTDDEPQEGEYPLPESVIRVPLGGFDLRTENGRKEHAQRLYQAVREHGVDMLVYHAWVSPILLWDMLAAKSAGAAVYLHAHNIFSIPLLTRGMNWAYQVMPEVYALADGVLALTETDRQYWSLYNSRVFRVSNPIPFSLKDTPVSRLEGKNIVWVGRISREKLPMQAIEIFAKTVQSVPDARMTVVGGGNVAMEDDLKKRARELSVADKVRFVGFQEDVRPYYLEADVFLCTSQYEGFCLTILEAQSMGLPVVSYEMPYLPILQTGLGSVSVPQEDTDKAAQELTAILQNDELRRAMGRDARRSIEENFDIDLARLWGEIIVSTQEARVQTDKNAPGRMVMDTVRTHLDMATAIAGQTGAQNTRAAQNVRTEFVVPMPKKGPCKVLRKKACTFINVLLIEGFSGLRTVIRQKRRGE